ncbi:MAG: hypothetical protein WAL26_30495 [Mycobacterium sp.]
MRTRTALSLATTIVALKAVLIGVVARGRCEMMGRCGDGTAWYVAFGAAALVLAVLLVVTIGRVRLAQTHFLSRSDT